MKIQLIDDKLKRHVLNWSNYHAISTKQQHNNTVFFVVFFETHHLLVHNFKLCSEGLLQYFFVRDVFVEVRFVRIIIFILCL